MSQNINSKESCNCDETDQKKNAESLSNKSIFTNNHIPSNFIISFGSLLLSLGITRTMTHTFIIFGYLYFESKEKIFIDEKSIMLYKYVCNVK